MSWIRGLTKNSAQAPRKPANDCTSDLCPEIEVSNLDGYYDQVPYDHAYAPQAALVPEDVSIRLDDYEWPSRLESPDIR